MTWVMFGDTALSQDARCTIMRLGLTKVRLRCAVEVCGLGAVDVCCRGAVYVC